MEPRHSGSFSCTPLVEAPLRLSFSFYAGCLGAWRGDSMSQAHRQKDLIGGQVAPGDGTKKRFSGCCRGVVGLRAASWTKCWPLLGPLGCQTRALGNGLWFRASPSCPGWGRRLAVGRLHGLCFCCSPAGPCDLRRLGSSLWSSFFSVKWEK